MTHAFPINDQLIHAMDMFTHSRQLIDKTKCFTFSSYKRTNKSVAHFLLTNTPTKCCTFPSYKTHTQQPKKVTCAIMAKVKSHLVTLDWQTKKSFPKKI